MSLKKRQEAMRSRLELEREQQHEQRRPDIAQDPISGHCPGMSIPEIQARSRPTTRATDIQTDAPRARLLDLKSAGAYLGVSYWTMRDLVFAGVIPSVKIPCPRTGDGRAIRRILVDRRDLDAFIEKNKELEQ